MAPTARLAASLLWLCVASACRKASAPTATAVPTRVERFAVGVTPQHCVPGLGEASLCCFDFHVGDVLTLEPDGEQRLTKEGPFGGTCGGRVFDRYQFESAKVAKVGVALVATKTALTHGLELNKAPLELDARHPDWTLSLHASPADRDGHWLQTGHSRRNPRGYARWRMQPGCQKVVRAVPYEEPGEGFERPADEIQLAPVAPGVCTLEVTYFDAHATATVTVR